MNATEFLDLYGDALSDSAHAAAASRRGRPLGELMQRRNRFHEVRDHLHAAGVTDAAIWPQFLTIMGFIVAHLGDLAAILALVMPLFATPAPVGASTAEKVYGTDV